jgi:phage shock protein PspC (stress-responsive transcriptional regulator)
MKKTVNINLGGFPFTIDEDAYAYLNNYLSTIENHFSKSEGCEDIISDIEYRICELFQESLQGRQIISMKELDEIIKIMGKPEDFGAESIEDNYHHYTQTSREEPLIKTGKKLYRDTEHGMIAGVIAGLAAYFGIKNTLIIRVLWLVFSLTGGLGVLTYLILWAVVPEATTASDKLAMKGEPINVENIAKTIEEEIDDLSKKITDLSNGLSKKRNKKGDSSSKNYKNGFTI